MAERSRNYAMVTKAGIERAVRVNAGEYKLADTM
jgi:hypothetical protein